MEKRIDTLTRSYQDSIGKHLKNTFMGVIKSAFKDEKVTNVKNPKGSKYYTVTDLGKGNSAIQFKDRLVEQSVRTSWGGSELDFSDRIWKNQDKLKSDLRDTITQGFIKGEDTDAMAQRIADKYDVALHRAKTLVQTETNRVFNQAQVEGLKEQGHEYGVIQSKGDSRTSSICEKFDGELVKLSEAVPGVNAPPFHPNCRSILVPKIIEQPVLKRWSSKDEEEYDWDSLPSDMQDQILKGRQLTDVVGFDAPNVEVPKDIFDNLPKKQQDKIIGNGLYKNVKPIKSPVRNKDGSNKFIKTNGKYDFGDKPLVMNSTDKLAPYEVDNRLGFNSVDQAKDFLEGNLGIKNVAIDDICDEVVVSVTNKLESLIEQFPNMQGKFSSIITDNEGIMACGPRYYITNADGSKGVVNELSINPKYFKNVEKLKKSVKDNVKYVKDGWFPKGTTWESSITHEFGHALSNDLFDGINRTSRNTILKNIYKKAIAKLDKVPARSIDKDYYLKYVKENVSEYATYSYGETFAEAFSDYIENGDNASLFSKEVMKLVYKAKGDYIKNAQKTKSDVTA